MLKVKVTHVVDVQQEYPNVFKQGESKYYYYCEGTKGGLYKLIEYKNGHKALFRAKDMQPIRNYGTALRLNYLVN